MRWYHYLAYFFGGAFLGNCVPHFVNGISGRRFPTPFADPPGQGESSAMVNVLWGVFNLVIGYLLLAKVGDFRLRRTVDAVVFGLGVVLIGLMLSQAFGQIYGGA